MTGVIRVGPVIISNFKLLGSRILKVVLKACYRIVENFEGFNFHRWVICNVLGFNFCGHADIIMSLWAYINMLYFVV